MSESSQCSTSAVAAGVHAANEPTIVLLRIRECFGYLVAANVSGASDYYCESWGLDKPVFTGELLVLVKDKILLLRLIQGGQLFSDSIPFDCSNSSKPVSYFLETVRDSRRYYVFNLSDAVSHQKIKFGIGFRERNDAFDLNAAITDYYHQYQRHLNLDQILAEKKEHEETLSILAEERLAAVKLDNLSLPQGKRIVVKLKTTNHSDNEKNEEDDNQQKKKLTSIPILSGLRLAPPPTAQQTLINHKKSYKSSDSAELIDSTVAPPAVHLSPQFFSASIPATLSDMSSTEEFDDEFTDFTSAK
jgi:hypothetical protein